MEFTVSIGAQSSAVFVWLTSKDFDGRFSENGFLLTESFKTVHTHFRLLDDPCVVAKVELYF